MNVNDLRSKITSEYDNALKQGEKNVPPWAKRKYIILLDVLNHPDLAEELSLLLLCTSDSIYLLRKVLIEYFVRSYDITTEVSESLVSYLSGGSYDDLSPFNQVDGVSYFNDDKNVVGPASPAETSDNESFFLGDGDEEQSPSYVNIRVGRSANKQDVLWFVEKYWPEMEKLLDQSQADKKQVRPRNMSKRDNIVYKLTQKGYKPKDIEAKMQDFEGVLDYATQAVIIKKKRPKYSLFDRALRQIAGIPEAQLKYAGYQLHLNEKGEQPYLELIDLSIK